MEKGESGWRGKKYLRVRGSRVKRVEGGFVVRGSRVKGEGGEMW